MIYIYNAKTNSISQREITGKKSPLGGVVYKRTGPDIPCSLTFKDYFKDGQVLEESEFMIVTHAEISHLTQIDPIACPPIHPKPDDQDQLWEEAIRVISSINENYSYTEGVTKLKQKFAITRKP